MSDLKDSEKLFISTKPVRLFFKASLPGAIGMLASSTYYLTETIFVGRMLGEDAFAGLNLAMPFILIAFALADLVGVGSSVPISIKLGQGKSEEANKVFSLAVVLIFLFGLISGIFFYIAAPFIFRAMGASAEIVAQATSYMRVYAVFAPFASMSFAFDNYTRISGRINRSMFVNIFMSVMCFSFQLIFLVLLRLPIAFAALASSLGMLITTCTYMYPFLKGRMTLHFRRPEFKLHMIKVIVSNGLPSFLSNMSGRIVSIVMNAALLAVGGATAVSIYGILMSIDGLVLPTMYGLCDSLQPAVGYNWGAGRKDRVRAIERCCYTASISLCLLAFAVLMLFPEGTAALFVSDAADIISGAHLAIIIFAFNYLIRWLNFSTQSFSASIGKPLYAAMISVSQAFVFPILFIVLLYPVGQIGLLSNITAATFATAVVALVILIKLMSVVSDKHHEKQA